MHVLLLLVYQLYYLNSIIMCHLPSQKQQQLKQIVRQLRTQYVEGIYRPNYPVTLKSRLRFGSFKVTVNGTIGQIIYDLVVIELFDGEYYRDLEMWVRGQSRSLKIARFDRPRVTLLVRHLYLVPFSSYLTLNNIVTLKSGLQVTQDY